MNDGAHSYSYDQEGNPVYVDGGQTTWDNYDALNRRVLHVTGGYTNYKRYEYDIDGRLAGVWQDEDTYQRLQRYYGPKGDSFAYWTGGVNLSNEQVHYQHTDYLGTVKARTDPGHNTEAYYVDLPFGERAPDLIASTDANTEHYATLDRDTESDTHHAQFRTYEPRIGRWLQPDPYDGSYDVNNPQSWNRYSYAMNNPLSRIDPSSRSDCDATGTEAEWAACVSGGYTYGGGSGCTYNNCVNVSTPDDFCWVCLIGAPDSGSGGVGDGSGGSGTGGGIGSGDGPLGSRPYTPSDHPSSCLVSNINAVNSVSNLNVDQNNVVSQPSIFNGGLNVEFRVPNAEVDQLPTGRYALSTFTWLFGLGRSLHVPQHGIGDPSTYGYNSRGDFTFTTHIDSFYSTWHTPLGAFLHWLVDVRGKGSHPKPC